MHFAISCFFAVNEVGNHPYHLFPSAGLVAAGTFPAFVNSAFHPRKASPGEWDLAGAEISLSWS